MSELDKDKAKAKALAIAMRLRLLNIDEKPKSQASAEVESYPIRQGDVTEDDLSSTFGFSGVITNINLLTSELHWQLNQAYDTFRLLAILIRQPMKAIGLGGILGMSIGVAKHASNVGGSYAPYMRMLQFKDKSDFKHIAHEWFHAFDHYLNIVVSNRGKRNLDLQSETDIPSGAFWRLDFMESWNTLLRDIKKSNYYKLSEAVAEDDKNDYWESMCELLARAFEVYIEDLMIERGEVDKHLVSRYPLNPYPNYSDPSDMPIADGFKRMFSLMTADNKFDSCKINSLGVIKYKK